MPWRFNPFTGTLDYTESSSGGSGDMLKSVYDTDNDGIVEQADVITNQGALATKDTITNGDIDNGAIGYSNLAGTVQSSLDLADSALQNVVEDTTPQLGGTLDTNAKWISNGGTAGTGFFVGSTGTGTFTAPSNANYSNVNSGNNAAGFQFAAETDTDNHRWRFYAATNGALIAYDVGNAATRFLIDSTGKGRFYNDLQVDGDLVVDTDTLTTDIATGRVGIGTASPSTALYVKEVDPSGTNRTSPINVVTIEAESNNLPFTGFGGKLSFKNRAYASGVVESAAIGALINNASGTNHGGSLVFYTQGTTASPIAERMRVHYNGNVGIGTTSPSAKLDVAGNIAVSGTVDGRDIAADGTKLDGIETGATADQNASEVPVSATPTNYTAASANVEAHLAGIDTALAGAGGGGSDYIQIQEQKASGNGQSLSSGSWQTRVLNTEVSDSGGHATLASNQITLAAGTYEFRAECSFYATGVNQLRLANVTDSSYIYGLNNYVSGSDGGEASVCGKFTIASSKTFELQHRVSTTNAIGGGIASGFGQELFANIEFHKTA